MLDAGVWEECSLKNLGCDECTGVHQYVSEVLDFSSQYGSDISISYTAYNITGKPSKFPDYGDFPQAFVMRTYGKWWCDAPSRPEPIMMQNYGIQSHDYIDVLFEQKVYPEKVTLFETYNPGSVVRIWASDGMGKWKVLWEGEPQVTASVSRKFSPVIQQTDFMTNLLRIEFNHSELDYYTELDAILLVGSHSNNAAKASNKIQKEFNKIASQIKAMNIEAVSDYVDMTTTLYSLTTLAQQYSSMLDDINREIEQSSKPTSGPFDKLPDEAVLRILSYLDLVSLCRCTRVNKHFYRLASDAMLHTAINLKPYWHRVNSKTVDYLSSRCKYLQKIDFSWCGNYSQISPQQFIAFIDKCGKLIVNLRLDCCKFLDDDCVKQIALSCRSLRELSIRNCLGVTQRGFESLASITTFQRLDFYRTSIETEPLVKLLQQNPDLRHINLGSCVSLSSMDTVAQCLGAYNHRLVSVDFWKIYSLTPIGVKALANCSKLEEVDLGWCLGVSIPGDSLIALATGCPKLRKLFLAALRGITDRDLAPFLENCPQLQQVDLLGVRSITPHLCLRNSKHPLLVMAVNRQQALTPKWTNCNKEKEWTDLVGPKEISPSEFLISPVSALYESFTGANRPSFTFTPIESPTIQWICKVTIPGIEISGTGCSTSKKTAKVFAAIDVRKKIREEIPNQLRNGDKTTKENENTSDDEIKIPDHGCHNSSDGSPDQQSLQLTKKNENGIEKFTSEDRWRQLHILAKSEEVKTKHSWFKSYDPSGYLIMLCSQMRCPHPTYTDQCLSHFSVSVELGPWSAQAGDRSKKLAKFRASAKLLSIIENSDLVYS